VDAPDVPIIASGNICGLSFLKRVERPSWRISAGGNGREQQEFIKNLKEALKRDSER